MLFYQHTMKSGTSLSTSAYLLCAGVLLGLLSNAYTQHRNDEDISRALYVSGGLPMTKSGWRPIVSSGALPGYNFASVINSQTPAVPKIMTGGTTKVETKGNIPHLAGVSHIGKDYFGNGILSTSTRPLVTRDVNKLTSIAQTYKPMIYQQGNINLNSPVNSYLNPFSVPSGSGIGHYKVTPGYQFDSNIFVRHPQTILNHRPSNYNKIPNQVLLGKRLKHNQLQAQMLQQLATNHYHQSALQSYQNSLKKPLDPFSRPLESFSRPGESFLKPNINTFQKHVNPQESLSTQTKAKAPLGQTVTAVTYKPPLGSHFQQFGLNEDSFGPIPSSILGSFSSFGHASVKARDPPFSGTKNGYLPTTPTKAPYVSTETYTASSTANNNIKISPLDVDPSSPPKPLSTNAGISDEYTRNLVPPPQVGTYESNLFNEHPILFNRTQDDRNPSKFNFIPSPIDPLSKLQNSQDSFTLQNAKIKQHETFIYNTNLPTKRPDISSFFETTLGPAPTAVPFESQSTNAVPGNLLAQVPPPYTTINAYNGQSGNLENVANKDKYQSFTSINHGVGPPPLKYAFEEVKYFPLRGQDYFETKFPKTKFELNTKEVAPYRGSYEVTENWGSSGETNTQPTLHSWLKPAQSFKQYNTVLSKPKIPSFNAIPNHDDRLPFFPTPMSSKNPEAPKNTYSDVSTVYSTISENNKNKNFFSQLENSLSSLVDIETQSTRPVGDETYDLAAPANVSFDDDIPKTTSTSSTTQTYEEPKITQKTVSRRKPSRYRTHHEVSTAATVDEDSSYTTRFEMFKEPTREAENDLHIEDMPTIPPSKHFRRPTATPSTSDNWEDNVPKKRIKNRRRRPQMRPTSTTTVEVTAEDITTTDAPVRTYRYRTTTASSEIEETTKLPEERKRPKLRLSSIHKTRPTKASSLPDFTSSAQPTMLPTVPATLRPKLHSRVRITTMPPLDLEDLFETTTPRGIKIEANNDKQSSIMKIAKDRLPNVKVYSTSSYENFHETPDHTHKQDEKDTPTSDISVNTQEYKYSAQKLHDGSVGKVESTTRGKTEDVQSNTVAETSFDPTSATFVEDSYSENNIQASQTTRSEQLFTELKSGNRGHNRLEEGSRIKNEETEGDSEAISTTPTTSTSKSHRLKVKPNKYDSNRPRFSVKDYRNRLNQYTSTSSTEKPITSESTNRLRFPNRSRFPSFKDQYGDSKTAGSDIFGTTTELPRKKFTPKDPRHRGSSGNDESDRDEKFEISTASGIKVPPPGENEVVTKSVTRLRGGNRRDPNRLRSTTTTSSTPVEVKEKAPQKPNNQYINLKRPTLPGLRKRIQNKNKTVETTEQVIPEVTSPTIIETTSQAVVEEKNETSTEKYTSETAIMKIAKDERKHPTSEETSDNPLVDQSQRVSDLTLAASKEYNTPGLFKSVSPNTRRVPNYFTIATDDPILPIEAFFPQLNQKKET